jgi:anti-anti-sigma factor
LVGTAVTDSGTNDVRGARWRLGLAQARRNGTLVIDVSGRLAAAAVPQLTSVLADALSAGERRIVLDLRRLDYINSAGVLALEAVAARLRSEGGELTLCAPTPPVRLALSLAGFPDDVAVVE